MADQGKNITKYLGKPEKGHFAKLMKEKNLKRTTIDFSSEMVDQLDEVADSLNISRQALIKTVLQEYIIRYKTAYRKGA